MQAKKTYPFSTIIGAIDTETAGLRFRTDPLIEIARSEYAMDKGEFLKEQKLLTRVAQKSTYEAAVQDIGQGGKKIVQYASKIPLPDFESLDAKGLSKFRAQAITELFTSSKANVMFVKNIGFESKFFSSAFKDLEQYDPKMARELFGQIESRLAGYSAYDSEHYRIGISSKKIRNLKTKATRAYAKKNVHGQLEAYQAVGKEIVNILEGSHTSGKMHLLDLEDLGRGVFALAQQTKSGSGMLMKQTGDVFSGQASDVLTPLFLKQKASHHGYVDTVQENRLGIKLYETFKQLESAGGNIANIADESVRKDLIDKFHRLEQFQAFSKKLNPLKNWLSMLREYRIDPNSPEIGLKSNKLEKPSNVSFYDAITGTTEDYDVLVRKRIKTGSAERITAYAKTELGLDASADTITRYHNMTADQLKVELDQLEKTKRNYVDAFIADDSATQRKIFEGLGSDPDVSKIVSKTAKVPITPTSSSARKFGLWGLAALGGYMLLASGDNKKPKESEENVLMAEDLEAMNPSTAFARQFPVAPSSLGASEEELTEKMIASKTQSGPKPLFDFNLTTFRGDIAHRRYETEYALTGQAQGIEQEVNAPGMNMRGYIDWVTNQDQVADIKTQNSRNYAVTAAAGVPRAKNVSQLNFYAGVTGRDEIMMRYMDQGNTSDQSDMTQDYDPELMRKDLSKVARARKKAARELGMRQGDSRYSEAATYASVMNKRDSQPIQHYRY